MLNEKENLEVEELVDELNECLCEWCQNYFNAKCKFENNCRKRKIVERLMRYDYQAR